MTEKSKISAVGAFVAAVAFASAAAPAMAQPTALPDVRAATAEPTVGERVVEENGLVATAFFKETRICTVRGCRSFIYDKRSGALILNDRVWSAAYARTGRGEEVIRVSAFTSMEYPRPAPSDAPLETAPAIKKVIRPQHK